MKKMHFIKKNIILNAIMSMVHIVLFLCTNFLSGISFETKLNYFSNDINNYYTQHSLSINNAPIVKIKKEDFADYRELFEAFYYSNEVTNLRFFGENKISLFPNNQIFESTSFECTFHYNYSYSIHDKYDWGYYLDSGLFSTYYKDEYLPKRGYLTPRFNSDGFVFISDTFANLLLSYYGISSFEQLIMDENYCLLKAYIGSKELKFCINNIIYSNERTGPRVEHLENLFCLYHTTQNIYEDLSFCIEVDLRSDIYGTSLFLKQLNYLGHTINNTEIEFKTYDSTINEYIVRADLYNRYVSFDFENSNDNYEILIVILATIPILLVFFIFKRERTLLFAFFVIVFNIAVIVFKSFSFYAPYSNIYLVITLGISVLYVASQPLFTYLTKQNNAKQSKTTSQELEEASFYEIKM